MTKADIFMEVQGDVDAVIKKLSEVLVILENGGLVQKANSLNNLICRLESWQGKVACEDDF